MTHSNNCDNLQYILSLELVGSYKIPTMIYRNVTAKGKNLLRKKIKLTDKNNFQQYIQRLVSIPNQKKGKLKKLMPFGYLSNDVIDVIINISLSVNSIRIHAPINIIFQEEVPECHQIFLLECDNHLVTQSKSH